MSENYIQYLGGYIKENIDFSDIEKAIVEIQETDDEHGVFWVSVTSDDENVIETDKFLNLAIVFDGNQIDYEAKDWLEVKEFYKLLLEENFEAIKQKIEKLLITPSTLYKCELGNGESSATAGSLTR